MSTYGKKICELRKKRKLTQSVVADALGISVTTISRYENETILPTEDVIVKTAQYFNVSSDYLLGLSSYPKEKKEFIIDYERNKEKAEKFDRIVDYFKNEKIIGD